MAKFCPNCGKPLIEGKVCSCGACTSVVNFDKLKTVVESTTNRMGIGIPQEEKVNVYENDKPIVPDCVNPTEGEITVKQYEVATLRNRILGIPYAKAKGRVQVTNKRVIFRAPGRSITGRTTLQHEFAIDELAGMEIRKENYFSFWDFVLGSFISSIGSSLCTSLLFLICSNGFQEGNFGGLIFLSFLFGIAGCVPFFLLKKKWLLKLFCLGFSSQMLTVGSLSIIMGKQLQEYSSKGDGLIFFGVLLVILGVLVFALTLVALIIYSIKPNLVLVMKTKSASEAIDIRRKKTTFFGRAWGEEHTGFTEVIPVDNVEVCIKELNAMITDIQKMGDFGIDKWKA